MRNCIKTRGKKIITWVFVVFLALSFVQIPTVNVEAAPQKKVQSVKLNYTEYTLKKGKQIKLKATISPKGVKGVTWKSNKKSVATVNSKGVVKAVKNGKATITATVKGTKKKATCKITVGTPVKSVSVTDKTVTLKVGEASTIKTTVAPKNASNKKLTYSSSNDAVAKVNAKGMITAIAAGKTAITVKAKDGSNKKALVEVTVIDDANAGKTPEAPETIEVSAVTVKLNKNEIQIGETANASVDITPANASVKEVVWSSSDQNIADIDETGKVTAKAVGTVTITATAKNGTKGTAQLKVVPVPVTGVNLSTKTATMNVNTTLILSASVTPVNASNKKINWKSSDDTIAKVDANGKVSALKQGEATVTAVSEDGKKEEKCVITVTSTAEVDNIDELQTFLSQESLQGIIYTTNEVGEVEIPEGSYPDKELIVNAPAATITNHATFKKIKINQLSENTWIEKAINNRIELYVNKAHIIISDNALATLSLKDGVGEARIENNGTIDNIWIEARAQVAISGSNKTEIPVTTLSKGTLIQTEIQLAIDAEKDFTLKVRPGAENSRITIPDESVSPSILGIGVIEVTNSTTNEISDVVADNTKEDEAVLAKGTITGSVSGNSVAMEGASVYLLPYSASIEKNDIDATIEEATQKGDCKNVTTDSEGRYELSEIAYGNYLLIVKSEGYKDYLSIVTLNQSVFTNEEVKLIVPSESKVKLSGTIYDAKLGDEPVPSGITLRLREGNNTTFGMVVATATTDENGCYQFTDVEPGNYTVQVTDVREEISESERYIRMSFNVTVMETDTVKDMTISQQVTDNQVRFVLTWGSYSEEVSEDLDSHLTGPKASGAGKFHTYYSDKTYEDEDENDSYIKYADLDYDDVDYEGPETTTVYQDVEGEYHFYIYDFTNQHKRDNTILSTSKAVVKVYRGEQNIATYNVPDGIGTLWDVCTYNIHTNTLTPVNKIYYHPGNSGNVGMDPLDIARENLQKVVGRYAGIDMGETLRAEISGKIAEANELLASSDATIEDLSVKEEELENYFDTLLQSTRIETVSANSVALKNWHIERQCYCEDDEEYYEEYETGRGYSVLSVTVKDGRNVYDDLNITLSDKENATYSWLPSDKEGYDKLLVVSNKTTSAEEKYYTIVTEYIPDLYPEYVEDGDNYILSYYTDAMLDENGFSTLYFRIRGENETLSDPVFGFEDEEVTGVYSPISEDDTAYKGYSGKITIIYRTTTIVLPVKYEQGVRKLYLSGISETGNYIYDDQIYYSYYYDEENDDEYMVWQVKGENATLGENTKILLSGVEEDAYTYILKSVEDQDNYNYIVTVTYKGVVQTLRIMYQQLMRPLTLSSVIIGDENCEIDEKWIYEEDGDYSWQVFDVYGTASELDNNAVLTFEELDPSVDNYSCNLSRVYGSEEFNYSATVTLKGMEKSVSINYHQVTEDADM